jgi:hypothetical protein
MAVSGEQGSSQTASGGTELRDERSYGTVRWKV